MFLLWNSSSTFKMFARVSWIAMIVIMLFYVYTFAQVVSQACLGCICEVRTGCNTTIGCFGTVCGPFAITWRYWSSAGKPTLNNENLNVNSYSHCVNDPYCAARAVENYMSKFGHDCNGDGVVDCEDYGRIHRFGPNGCITGTLDAKYENKFKLCLQTQNFFQ